MPSIAIVEVLDQGRGFRYRLVGGRIAEIAGRNAAGRMLDSNLYGPGASRLLVPYKRVVAERLPVQSRSPVLFTDTWRATDNMFVPFTTSDGAVDQIIVSVHLADGMAASQGQRGQISVVHAG